jgi:hypothetical protein
MNSPIYVDGLSGSAIYLHGNGQWVRLPAIPLDKFPAFTIMLWAKVDGLTVADGEALISFGSDLGQGMIAIMYAPGQIGFTTDGHEFWANAAFPSECLSHWAHYALVYDHGVETGYINGRAVATRANVPVGLIGRTAGLGTHWWVNNGVSTRFIGAMGEVRIYGRALTQEQVLGFARAFAVPP